MLLNKLINTPINVLIKILMSILISTEQLFFLVFQVLVLGNKRDLPSALDEKQLIEKM